MKQISVHYREYYKAMKDAYSLKIKVCEQEIDSLYKQTQELVNFILSHKYEYLKELRIDIEDYKEIEDNKFIDGKLFDFAKRKLDKDSLKELPYNLYSLATKQKRINELEEKIIYYRKFVNLSVKEYLRYLNVFANEVHRQLVVEGNAYKMGYDLGVLFINRFKTNPKYRKNKLDFAATRKRKQEMIDKGIKIFNKEEYDYCQQNGLEYNGQDYRVYLDKEYVYEVAWLYAKFPEAGRYTFDVKDFRAASIRGKNNDELIEECNRDKNKICELPVDLKTKLNMCLKVDDLLHLKYIRHENQKSTKHRPTNS